MRSLFWRIFWASVSQRKGRVAVSVCAIALGTSLVVASVNLRQGIGGKLAEELKHYGANLLLLPADGTGLFLKEKELGSLAGQGGEGRLLEYAPFLHQIVKIRGKDAVLVGTRFAAVKKVSPWWQVEGDWPEEKDAVLVGSNLASKLGLRPQARISVAYKASRASFTVAGVLSTGGAEEHQIFVDLESSQVLTGRDGLLSAVLVRSRVEKGLDGTAAFLRRAWPGAEVRTLWQVARAEDALLSRVEILLTLVSLIILFASGVAVFATMSTVALERKIEIALMRALGAEERRVALIFACEAFTIGLAGGLVGSVLGLLFAEGIGLTVFRSFVIPSLISLPAGLSVGLGVALFSSLSVVRKVGRTAPAAVLRGE
ncbi:MAG: ABC transporter permease [Deltaproteobacteria bacterium]|nr:ABC transporter permease [Deltaproteobacteria bacterium]